MTNYITVRIHDGIGQAVQITDKSIKHALDLYCDKMADDPDSLKYYWHNERTGQHYYEFTNMKSCTLTPIKPCVYVAHWDSGDGSY